MPGPLFGELLGRFAPLSGHDVAEILEEQSNSHRRFGEIALAHGLCAPADVWKAWWAQLGDTPPQMDLEAIGIDTQAIKRLPARVAHHFQVIPLRAMGSQMVLATTADLFPKAASRLPALLHLGIKFVFITETQLRPALAACYPRATKTSVAEDRPVKSVKRVSDTLFT